MTPDGGAWMYSDDCFSMAAESQPDWGITVIPPCLEGEPSEGDSLIQALAFFDV